MLNDSKFYTISNLGGGGSDKYRENSYKNLYGETPILCNYRYLDTETQFANKILGQLKSNDRFIDFLDDVQDYLVSEKGYEYKNYAKVTHNSNNELLLDSGARDIIYAIKRSEDIPNDINIVKERIWREAKKYYDFANKHEFDNVISFDLGGKYTFKKNEKKDLEINKFSEFLESNSSEINDFLREKTANYLKKNPNYKPLIYFTVCGSNLSLLDNEIKNVQKLIFENPGIIKAVAVGGVASSSNMKIPKDKDIKVPSRCRNTHSMIKVFKIVRESLPDLKIHVLGGGGYSNIPFLCNNGFVSFDCQTPGRRAYDGSIKNASNVFDQTNKNSFSKYLVGKINSDLDIINDGIYMKYENINKLDNNIVLCGCPACKSVGSVYDIKKLYSLGENDKEAYYLSRQLLNVHNVYQHIYLTKYCLKNGYRGLVEIFGNEYFEYFKKVGMTND